MMVAPNSVQTESSVSPGYCARTVRMSIGARFPFHADITIFSIPGTAKVKLMTQKEIAITALTVGTLLVGTFGIVGCASEPTEGKRCKLLAYTDHLDFVVVGTPRDNVTYDISITDLELGAVTACAYNVQAPALPELTCTSDDAWLTTGRNTISLTPGSTDFQMDVRHGDALLLSARIDVTYDINEPNGPGCGEQQVAVLPITINDGGPDLGPNTEACEPGMLCPDRSNVL